MSDDDYARPYEWHASVYRTNAGGLLVSVNDYGLEEEDWNAASSFLAARRWLARTVDERFLHPVLWERLGDELWVCTLPHEEQAA